MSKKGKDTADLLQRLAKVAAASGHATPAGIPAIVAAATTDGIALSPPNFGFPPPAFTVEMWPLERIKRYKKNPRRNEAAVGKLAASIREFGWQQPIVVDDAGVIIVGDTRYLAAQFLKVLEAPVKVATGLSPEQVRAYRLADNRIGEEAEWDDALLIDTELDELLGSTRGLAPFADPEQLPPVPVVATSQLGQMYKLGAHRLICGDSRFSNVWDRLLAGDGAVDMLWTDPPYDVDYVGKTKTALKIDNDALGLAGTVQLLRASLTLAIIHLKPGAGMYVCAPHGPQFWAFAKVGIELGWWRQTILWIKDSFVFGRSDMHYRHEAIVAGEAPAADISPADGARRAAENNSDAMPFADEPVDVVSVGYGWAPGKAHAWYGGRKQDTGWECDRPRVNDLHPTAKPVELVERAVRASSKKGDVVVDAFGGGGSLLVACEVAGRKARVIELDPRYVDAHISRWEELTGRKAELLQEPQ